MGKEPALIDRLTSGHMLATIPFLGSYVAFLYECGKLRAYDLPISYIQLDFTRIISATAVVFLFGVVILIVLALVFDLEFSENPIKRTLARRLFFLVVIGAFFFALSVPDVAWYFLFGAFAALLAVDLLEPYFSRKRGGAYLDRLKESLDKKPPDSRSGLIKWMGDKFIPIVGVIFFGSFLVVGLGAKMAKSTTNFWVLTDKSDYLYVTNYGETVLAKKIDRKTGELLDGILIIKVDGSNGLHLERFNLPVKFKESGSVAAKER